MRILKEQSVGLIIDIQERLFPAMYRNEDLKKNVNTFIEGLHVLKMPFLVTEQYTKGLGFTIPDIARALGSYDAIGKMEFSCCDNPDFMERLQQLGRMNVIIAGIESHVCVLQTVTDLMEKGFQPVIVEDSTSSRKKNDKRVAIERMKQEGAVVTTYESILFELARVSGTDQFKAISKLVK